jgi:two-component system, OmpR family, sensor histidine kinase KdpD
MSRTRKRTRRPREPACRIYDLLVPTIDRRRFGLLIGVVIPSLAVATLTVAFLETYVGIPNASIVYLAAVVLAAVVVGTPGAIVASVASLLLYDFFFTQPYLTFTISDPGEWLSVILLLTVGVVVGQLTALQRSRTEESRAREREARALFAVSRALATRASTPAVLPTIAALLRDQTRMRRVWISLGGNGGGHVAADTGDDGRPTLPPMHRILQRMPAEEPAQWRRVHRPTTTGAARPSGDQEAYRVRIEAGATLLGSIWGLRDRRHGDPDRTETRLVAAAADQLGQAIAHDRLVAEAQAAEIARQSDDLKTALLQSVSHDLRTPLATIRAAAGMMRPRHGLSAEEQDESADAIDREVAYLNRLVTNLLDLSRIEAGALRPERDVFEVDDLVGGTLDRLRPRLNGRPTVIDLVGPPVDVDPIFVDEAVTNALENTLKYTPDSAPVGVSSRALPGEPYVRLTIEDGGEGVPAAVLPRLFDKFYRVPGGPSGSRAGTGIGLAVTRGLIEATGGRVRARRSDLGGLAIDLDLPTAQMPATERDPARST